MYTYLRTLDCSVCIIISLWKLQGIRSHGKGKYKWGWHKNRNKRGWHTAKVKRSPDERHKKEHEENETFWHSLRSLAIRRGWLYVNTESRSCHIAVSSTSYQGKEQKEERDGGFFSLVAFTQNCRKTPALLCAHIHSPSSNWQRPQWVLKCCDFFTFSVRVIHFFSRE